MNRQDIKKRARDLIRGNLWTLWKPILIIFLVAFAIGFVSGILDPTGENALVQLILLVAELLLYPLSVGLIYYFLQFARGKKPEINDLWGFYKHTWPIIGTTLLVGIFTTLWTFLLIIPGIIAAISYSMVTYLMADGDINFTQTIKKSKEMMNGYKMDYFIFGLSFFWWMCLVGITFGIAIIYVGPYMSVAQTLYYEDLKKLREPKPAKKEAKAEKSK